MSHAAGGTMFEFIETKRHTVESVYGKPEAEVLSDVSRKAPQFDAAEFRPPVKHDILFPAVEEVGYLKATADWMTHEPRLILRRKTVKRRVLTETGEVRLPVKGDWYATSSGTIIQAEFDHEICHSPIYRETFVEVEA